MHLHAARPLLPGVEAPLGQVGVGRVHELQSVVEGGGGARGLRDGCKVILVVHLQVPPLQHNLSAYESPSLFLAKI